VLTIAIRFAVYVDLMLLFGLAALAVGSGLPKAGRWLAGIALLGVLFTAASVVDLAASMSGITLAEVNSGAIATILSVPALGTSIIVRMAALLVVAAIGILPFPAWLRALAMAVASGIALATLGWIGHGSMDSGAFGWVHMIADIVHLLAAAAWIGAIVGLLIGVVVARGSPTPERLGRAWSALAKFAQTGTLLVGAIVLTGLINGWAIVGPAGVPLLPTTPYGRLLIAKLLLFAAMLALAARNRFRHVPHLRRAIDSGVPGPALIRLRHSLVVEAGCGIAVLIAVAWLGTLDPGASG
jgi:putative copper resistance protein D